MKRLLIAGYGDIARRAEPQLASRFEVVRLARRYGFDLDLPQGLPAGGAHAVLHCAPPPDAGESDSRTANLLAALEEARIVPARLVYVSTSGVYGRCAGARIDETRPVAAQSQRAKRRADAEAQLSRWCAVRRTALVILRAPGIYAADRLPLARLRAGTQVLRHEDDVFTNHIHADDLAAAVARALEDDAPAGVYNASDDSEILMGDWMDLVADRHGLARPPRIARAEAAARIPAALMSFMSESRRLDNRRLKNVLGVSLRYPTVEHGLSHAIAAGADQPS